MASVHISPVANIPQFLDNNGVVLNGGWIVTYVAGSNSVLKTTYSDAAGTIPNANPLQLDSSGRANVDFWLIDGQAYHFVLYMPDQVTVLWSADGVTGVGASGGGGVTSWNTRIGAVVPIEGDYSLTQLSDVVLTSPSTGQVLTFDGTDWTNQAASGGVSSFNTRTGAVTLTSGDVTSALGFTPGLGTVTSVSAASGGSFAAAISVSASPITSSGTITLTPNLFTSSNAGVTPASGGGTANFLRADGTWAAPPATGVISFNTRTGAVTLTSGDVTTALGFTPLNKAGDTMSGSLNMGAHNITNILMAGSPANTDVATVGYVNAATSGLKVHAACVAATTANLTSSYVAGVAGGSPDTGAGVGATLTNTGTLASFAIDGYTTSVGNRVLLKDQTFATQNGVYTVTTQGSGAVAWVLTRATDFNNSTYGDVAAGALVFIQNGTLQAGSSWIENGIGTQSPGNVIKIGTDAITFTQFSASVTYSAGTGLTLVGTTFSNAGVLSNIAGTGISVSGATGNVTITNTGVTTFNTRTGAVTLTSGDVTTALGFSPGSVSSVGVSSAGAFAAAITVGSSPVTSSGTITLTPNLFGAAAPGIVPLSGGGTTNFLRADGAWAAPAGSSGVTSFNSRTGAVTLTFGDVTGALGYTPSSTNGTVTSVGVVSSGTYSGAITIGATPVTTSGNITITPNVFTNSVGGIAPPSGGGTANFMRADGTWAVPPGTGVTSFNSRTGAITLTSGDVTGALGYTPGTGNGTVTSVQVIAGLGMSGGGTITTAGSVTLNIGQAVATSSNVQFNAIGVNVANSTTGTIVATGNITAFSDIRLKAEIEVIEDALEKVKAIRGVTYKRIDTGEYGMGLIAQEVQKVAPETVVDTGEYLSVAYGNLVGLLVQAVKELAAKVEALETK